MNFILFVLVVTGNPSIIGRWRVDRVILSDELQYDRIDSTIAKRNFLQQQERIDAVNKQYFTGASRHEPSYAAFAENIEKLYLSFAENGEFQMVFPMSGGEDVAKGHYQILANKNILLLTRGNLVDTVSICLTDTSLELVKRHGRTFDSYVYSRIK